MKAQNNLKKNIEEKKEAEEINIQEIIDYDENESIEEEVNLDTHKFNGEIWENYAEDLDFEE